MPSNHRGQPVKGPHMNCASGGCGGKGEHQLDSGARLCKDCHEDYLTYLPYMHQGQYPSWEKE